MKVLVLGSTGMVGHTITLYLNEKGYNVTAYSRTPFPFCKNIIGNAFESKKIREILISDEYEIIINCIGLLNNNANGDISKAIYLNSYLPHFLVDAIKASNSKFIHLSTDCVFSGINGPYFEDSYCDSPTMYDKTKALGEVANGTNLTFRNSIIGPDMNEAGIGLLNWFLKQTHPVNGYTNAIWTGVTTLTLANAIEQAIKEDLSGLYHLVNNTSISKFELLCLFNKHFRNNEIRINKSDIPRIDKSLKNTRFDFSFKVPNYEQMIIEMREWVIQHKYLYNKQYKKI